MPLLDTLQQFDVPLTDFFTIFALLCLVSCLFLAAICGPLSAFALECVCAVRRKTFYDKCALQETQLSFLLLFTLYTALAVTAALLFYAPPPGMPPADYLRQPAVLAVLTLAAAPFGHLILLSLYLFLWTGLRKLRPVHLFFGLCAALASLAALLAIFLSGANAALLPFVPGNPLPVMQAMTEIFLREPWQWLLLGYAAASGFALAGALSLIWLVARRNRADYGRDYYSFAMRALSRQALFFTLAAAALAACFVPEVQQRLFPAFALPLDAALSQPWEPALLPPAFALPLVCCLLWFFVIRSQTPMRHKAGVIFACLFAFAAFCAQALGFLNSLPQP